MSQVGTRKLEGFILRFSRKRWGHGSRFEAVPSSMETRAFADLREGWPNCSSPWSKDILGTLSTRGDLVYRAEAFANVIRFNNRTRRIFFSKPAQRIAIHENEESLPSLRTASLESIFFTWTANSKISCKVKSKRLWFPQVHLLFFSSASSQRSAELCSMVRSTPQPGSHPHTSHRYIFILLYPISSFALS